MNGLIVKPLKKGKSKPVEVGGRKGVFDFDVPPKFIEGVGGGKSPLYLFKAEDGEFFYRLEKDKQGGRWEEADHAPMEFDQMKQNPELIQQMWGNSDIAEALKTIIDVGGNFKDAKYFLKKLNTHRQISGD